MAKGPKNAEKNNVEDSNIPEGASLNPYREQYDLEMERLEKLLKELRDKKYLLDVDKMAIQKLYNYISTDAPWKGILCFGIIELTKQLDVCLSKGKLFVDSVAVDAIHHFLTNVEGNGLNGNKGYSAEDLKNIFTAVLTTKEVIASDLKIKDELEFRVQSWAQGINPDEEQKEVDLTNE